MDCKETDLYEPIRQFLTEEGYQVQAEVKHCDMVAVKDGQMILIELKKAFNLKLVYQALDRQSLTELVFVAIPRPVKGQKEKPWKDMLKLLKRLELGLMTVALDSPLQTVDVILEPSDSIAWKNRKKRERLQGELAQRQVPDVNVGGMTRRKIMTAYREKAIELCCILEGHEGVSLQDLRDMGKEAKYAAILRSNVNGWYVRIKKGVYGLSQEGEAALLDEDNQKVVVFYQNFYRKET